MLSLRASSRQIHNIRTMRMTLPNKREMWLDALAGSSAGCRTDLTVTCGLGLCLRRSSLADNTGSSSLSAAAAAGVVRLWLAWGTLVDADVAVVVCGGGVGADAGRPVGCEEDRVTAGLDADAADGWTGDERTSDAEQDCTVADGIGWPTPAQTTDVGITLLATVDNGGMPGNAAGNIVEGGMKGNRPGPSM